MSRYIELIDKYRIEQSQYDTDYNPPNYIWTDNTGEVIRCEECKYFYENRWCVRYLKAFTPEDYCSYAERKK